MIKREHYQVRMSQQGLQRMAQAALVLLTVVAVIASVGYPAVLGLVALGIAVLGVMVVDRRLVIPIIIFTLPLEISKQFFPFLTAENTNQSLDVSIIDFSRLAILAAGVLWLATARRDWFRNLPQSSLYLPMALLLALYLLSITYSLEPSGALRETVRLVTNLALFALVLLFVQDRTRLQWALIALVGSGLALAIVGLIQQVADVYFWNDLSVITGVARRNATFADPNIYARFLVIAMVLALSLLTSVRGRLRYLMIATLMTAPAAALFTSSRSGWLIMATVIPVLLLVLPVSRRVKLYSAAGAGVTVVVLVAVALVVEPTLLLRLQTFERGVHVIGARYYLIPAGWHMFLDHPFAGLGVDSYRTALAGPYRWTIPDHGAVLPSHTALATILAELGLAGLIVTALLSGRWLVLCWHVYRSADKADAAVGAGLAATWLVIFLSSQSEGRFYEEPYLWLIFGLGGALEHIRRVERAKKSGFAAEGMGTPSRAGAE